MDQFFRAPVRLLWVVAVVLSGVSSGRALSVQIKGPDGEPAEKIDFGALNSSFAYHTAPQVMEISHPDLSFRKIYLYSDNSAGFGLAQEGLVSTVTAGSFPLFFRNFQSVPGTAKLTAADALNWQAVIDRSAAGFEGLKESSARLMPGSEHLSWVYLGLKIPPDTVGQFGARLVIEDWSDKTDVAGPTITHTPFSNLILLRDVPVGFSSTLVDESFVTAYSLFYRLDDGPSGYQEAKGEKPINIGAFTWEGESEVVAGAPLRGGDVLEYYFVAVDTWSNVSNSVHYRANVVDESGTASLPYTKDSGGVGVAIGDPRWPGLQFQFPAGSLRSGGTMTVALKDPSTVPLFEGKKPSRVFQLGPNDLSFIRPVSLLIPYRDDTDDGKEDGTNATETDLRLFWFDGFDWRYVGGTVAPATNQVRASVTRLGQFALFPSGPPTADDVRPKERILTSTPGHDVLLFSANVADGPFDIEIFDVRGASIRKIHNSNEWDGRDESGNRVESGTYVYRFEGQGLTLSGMIAVAR